MFLTKKYRFLNPAGVAGFFVGVAALLALAAPVLAQQGPFLPGDYCTYTQGGWGAVPQGNNPGMILQNEFSTTFRGFVEVGIPGNRDAFPFSMQFTTAEAISAYLPAGGKPKALIQDYVNSTTTGSGVFGGQVLALQLNVLYDPLFAGLTIINTGTSLDGEMVSEVLRLANTALGGGALPLGYTLSNLNDIVAFLNQGFDNCLPSGWAQQHLAPPLGGGDPVL